MRSFLKGLLFLVLCSSPYTLTCIHAQTPQRIHIFDDSDTLALSEAMRADRSDAQFTPEENRALADSLGKMKYALEQFKQVFVIKKDILWSDEWTTTVAAFYDTTFIMLYNTVQIQDRGVLISIVNSFGGLLENGEQDPFVKVNWVITPSNTQQLPYHLSLQIDHGNSIQAAWIDSLEANYNKMLRGKIYRQAEESKEEMLRIMNNLLNALGMKYGHSLAPAFALYYNHQRLSNGHQLMFMYSEEGNTYEEIYAGTLAGDPLEEEVQWVNVDSSAYSYAFIGKNTIKQYTLQAITAKDTIELKVNILTDDARELLLSILEELLVSVGQDMIDHYYAQYTEHRRTALSNITIDTSTSSLEEPVITLGDYGNVTHTEPIAIGPSQAYPLSSGEYEILMNDPDFRDRMNKGRQTTSSLGSVITEMKAIAVLKEMIRPENFTLVKNDIVHHLDSHVSALGSQFIQAVFSEDRSAMRLLFRNYLNSRLDHFYELMNDQE